MKEGKGVQLEFEQDYHHMNALWNDRYDLVAEYETVHLLALKAVCIANHNQPNSKNASMSKAN